MPCVSTFCCGYSLRSGGGFIGYFSIFVYLLLSVVCITVLWCIKLRIDDASPAAGGAGGWRTLQRFSNFIRARSDDNEIEETLQDLKIFSIFFLVYCLFLLFGILCSSFLITGAQLRKPGYLWWWLIYQLVFVIAGAGIVMIFVTIKDEHYGLTSYFKNFFFRTLIIAFISIYGTFVVLLIYFWISVLALHTHLRRQRARSKRRRATDAVTIVDSAGGVLNEGFVSNSNNGNNDESDNNNGNNTAGSSSSGGRPIQMIPISLGAGGKEHKDNDGKLFIIRV